MSNPNPHDDLRQLVAAASHMVAFTGAGISAESGIPTYRGDDGLWNKYDPAKFANIDNFYKDPGYYWNFFREVRYPAISKAQPNDAHTALAELEAKGILKAVITQNIDGLQQAAGSKNVLELHGNTRRIICLQCSRQRAMDDVYQQLDTELPPTCPSCGGTLKPDVVFFGESLPADVLEGAVAAAQACDLFLVVGSSLVVQPAAGLPALARRNGARLVIINRDPTPLDQMADLVFNQRASDVLRTVSS
ncbi:NAD-dependent protein deacetylase [Desulfosarcina ovata]|uniref:NAD-dependent protein deacetylase n=1 Tax=Desulfosarcina ovata subsp. ovata TaxID=2752305 RepID=A0A5K8AFU5_9BACT|nr:NAD-dependent protein deacetylase [Desulfosarcina ovata]BBO91398.1 NAD-dependent deacetylase [Desulfosarcina ovata subsp. ovata]